MRPRKLSPSLFVLALVAPFVAGCGGSSGGGDAPSDALPGDDAGGDAGGFVLDAGDDAAQTFDVTPAASQTLTVPLGSHTPTVTFQATLGGAPANAVWSVDRGEIGTIDAGPAPTAAFAPSGTVGGAVTITAKLGAQTLTRIVFVKLGGKQNGGDGSVPSEATQLPVTLGQLSAGGGVGGVGGEGLGGQVTDPATLAALASPSGTGSAQSLTLLYPYDKTVFPRGLLAPLLQWSWTVGDADAIAIHLETTSGSFTWDGTFARPAILTKTGGKFIRHPIPQDVWAAATNSAGSLSPTGGPDRLSIKLTVARGGKAYGPLEETWTIAPGRLAGTVYYNSYGTQLVRNSIEPSFNNGPQFGAAVLGIKAGATGPTVVAGRASPLGSGAGCRVCHDVAASGNRLVVQHGDVYPRTSSYELKSGNAETVLSGYDGVLGWAGLSPDGKLALTNGADLAAGTSPARLYDFPPTSTTPLTMTGLPTNASLGAPAFSPDGKHVAFDFLAGTIGPFTGNGTQLLAVDFDAASRAFSNPRVLATMTSGHRAGFPSFFPTNDAVAFHYQITPSNHRYNTWHGATAQIWWSDLATGTAKGLYALNGLASDGTTSTLPTGPNNHADDTILSYEPTVAPVATGGYVWVIFTSRRLYGNVAVTDPWQSDPRGYDATQLANTTCKKLWVAAIDLNAKPGTDPSHPAFYLPGQELLAGNARGFWVMDPCRADGQSCDTGDQCCGGYCESGGAGGALICSSTTLGSKCAQVQEKCSTAADCCDASDLCVNGFCAVPGPS